MKNLDDSNTKYQKEMFFAHLDIFDPIKGIMVDQGLHLKDGKISTIQPAKEFYQTFKDREIISAKGYMVMPGMVNGHTHASMGFFRGLGHGKDAMIENFLFPAEKSLTIELLEPLSWSYLIDGLKSGVTTFVDHYYFVAGVGKAMERLGVRGVIGETVADLGGAFPDSGAWSRQVNLLKNWDYQALVRPCLAPHAADTVSAELIKKIVDVANQENLPMHFHLSQTQGEMNRVMQRENMTPVEYFSKHGALSERSLGVHLVSATENDLDILSDSGVNVGFCPQSQIIYEKLAPIEKFIEKQLPVVLGTDCAASNDSGDILSELKMVGLMYMDRSHPKNTLSYQQLFQMVLSHPYQLFFPDKKLGCIQESYEADLVFIKKNIELQPFDSSPINLVYSSASKNIKHVMVEGKWVLWDEKPVLVNLQDLNSEFQSSVNEISKRVNIASKD